MTSRAAPALLLGLIGLGFVGAFGIDAWNERQEVVARAVALTGGDPAGAPAAIARFGCGGCHEIPDVTAAHGRVGPPLAGFAERVYIAGVLRNTPDNLIRWIIDPQSVDPLTVMPRTGIDEAAARDVAAFLLAQP
jgi:cytochrome c1